MSRDETSHPPAQPPPVAETSELDRWMYQFTAQLAHDMRAPMGAIFMWAHVLRASDTGDSQAAIEAIEVSARQQSRMLADLVDMTRAAVGRLPIERTYIDLGPIIEAAVDEKSKEAGARGVEVVREGAPSALPEIVIRGDSKRLQQALACLVTHGVASTPAGGRVTVGLSPEPEQIKILVRLPAGGLDAEALADLFTPYRAVGLDLTAARPDFGMGLAFARAIARLHDGSLEAVTEGPGGALTFHLRLPLPGPTPIA